MYISKILEVWKYYAMKPPEHWCPFRVMPSLSMFLSERPANTHWKSRSQVKRFGQESTHKQTNKQQTKGQMDGRYQVHHLPASRSIIMTNHSSTSRYSPRYNTEMDNKQEFPCSLTCLMTVGRKLHDNDKHWWSLVNHLLVMSPNQTSPQLSPVERWFTGLGAINQNFPKTVGKTFRFSLPPPPPRQNLEQTEMVPKMQK